MILILGGTAEAARMAEALLERGLPVLTSLAGRTREPSPLKGNVRTGGFGGAEGLAEFMRTNGVKLLIDMTHPFATSISANAERAADLSGIPLLAWQRPQWEMEEGDRWFKVGFIAEAVKVIPEKARVLLALGSQHIAPFSQRADVHFLVRMVDPPTPKLALPDHDLILAKPGKVEAEFALMREHQITHVVCRNSGGKASYTKIAAARLLGIQVILIGRKDGDAAVQSIEEFEQKILAALR